MNSVSIFSTARWAVVRVFPFVVFVVAACGSRSSEQPPPNTIFTGRAAEATPPGEWITGRAWDEGFWDPPNFPTAADLDALSTQHPMRFSRLGGHGSWVNSKALELGKITRGTPDPPGGRIVRDAAGNATGFLVDRAQGLLPRSRPDTDADEDSESRLRAGQQQYARWGVTSLHDAGADLGRIAIYKKLLDAGELPVRVYVMAGSGRRMCREWSSSA